MKPDLASLLTRHRALVCVGTGGVGKTTIAASLGLCAAMLGRRTMVLTIDPARQLARALGLSTLGRLGEPIATHGLTAPDLLHAGMLDQKGAWDAFITRHAPNPEVRDTLLGNPFYQRLSTSFAGSTEYMAIEELCRLDESRAYDLIIIDTPPSGHAVDFLRAPERIESLLDPAVSGWFLGRMGKGPLHALSGAVKFIVGRLERAMGSRTLREISAFFLALDALFGNVAERAARARGLLYGPDTAFLLVASPSGPPSPAGPSGREISGADALARTLRDLGAPLRGVVINRTHPLPGDIDLTADSIDATVREAGSDPELQRWLRATWDAARATARAERMRIDSLAAEVPEDIAWVELPELDHDAHSLADLAALAGRICPSVKSAGG